MTERSDNQDYAIELTPLAVEMLGTVNDRREQAKLRDRIDQLATEPSKQGKALVDKPFWVSEREGRWATLSHCLPGD
jgi:hypothetical protein